jgi:PAS domain S-box-containing protein
MSSFAFAIYVYGSLVLALAMIGLAVYAWRHRHVTGAAVFSAFLFVLAGYLLSNVMLLTGWPAAIFFYPIRQTFVLLTGLLLLLFVFQYTGKPHWLTPLVSAALWALPLLSLLLVWTNNAHHLVWTGFVALPYGSFAGVSAISGEGEWLVRYTTGVYSTVAALWILLTLVRSYALYRQQAFALLIGTLSPGILNILISLRILPALPVAITPLNLAVTALAFAWALFRYRLFDLKPIAHETLVERTSDGMLVLDPQNRIVDVNPTAQAVLGTTKASVIGQSFHTLAPDLHDAAQRATDAPTHQVDVALVHQGHTRFFDVRVSPLTQAHGKSPGRLVVLRDMTDRTQMEQALRQSEENYRQLIQDAPMAVGVCDLADPAFPIVFVNRIARELWQRIVGAEIIGVPVIQLLHSARPGLTAHIVDQMKNGGSISWLEERLVSTDGQVMNVLISERQTSYQGRPAALLMLNDITELKRTQAELQRREQMVALLEERARLGRDLHDSVTQLLYSVMLFADASRDAAQAANPDMALQYLARLSETAQQALKEMRLRVFELRPSVLEREGLASALQQRLDLVEQRAGVETELCVELPKGLAAPVELAIYWIAQEALNNTLKHAAAAHVAIHIRADETGLRFLVTDDGKGFDPTTLNERAGLGMASMQERARDLGGTFQIDSVPGQGTCVQVTMPAYVLTRIPEQDSAKEQFGFLPGEKSAHD